MLAAIGSTSTAATSCSASARVDRGEVVVGHDDGVGDRARRDPGGAGEPERRHAAAGRDEQRVEMAVVAAGELHDRVPAGRAPGEPHRGHRRLGPARHQPHLLDARARGRRSPRRAPPRARSARRRTCRRAPRPAPPRRCADRRGRGSTRPTTGRSRRSGCPRCRPAPRPRALATKNGAPPTASNARTGEFTPAGDDAHGPREQRVVGHVRLTSGIRRRRGRST